MKQINYYRTYAKSTLVAYNGVLYRALQKIAKMIRSIHTIHFN